MSSQGRSKRPRSRGYHRRRQRCGRRSQGCADLERISRPRDSPWPPGPDQEPPGLHTLSHQCRRLVAARSFNTGDSDLISATEILVTNMQEVFDLVGSVLSVLRRMSPTSSLPRGAAVPRTQSRSKPPLIQVLLACSTRAVMWTFRPSRPKLRPMMEI